MEMEGLQICPLCAEPLVLATATTNGSAGGDRGGGEEVGKRSFSLERQQLALHMLECATSELKRGLLGATTAPAPKGEASSSSSLLEELEENENEASRSLKKRKVAKQTPTTTTTTTTTTSTTCLVSASSSNPKKKRMSETEYDQFLLAEKEGRFERIGPWKGFSKTTKHRCTDPECGREWSPSPSQTLADDYYCPSCVLHHRNNVARFEEPRLQWTAKVPNTFYVFSLVDPSSSSSSSPSSSEKTQANHRKSKRRRREEEEEEEEEEEKAKEEEENRLVKFGRTQNVDAWQRYPAKERRDYKMRLLLSIRGPLKDMTELENWWKEKAQKDNLFQRFSVADFHGLSECINVESHVLDEFLLHSKSFSKQSHVLHPPSSS
ncbi:hypothetical protein QOT17_001414 [Balamuthia mandrillaris]